MEERQSALSDMGLSEGVFEGFYGKFFGSQEDATERAESRKKFDDFAEQEAQRNREGAKDNGDGTTTTSDGQTFETPKREGYSSDEHFDSDTKSGYDTREKATSEGERPLDEDDEMFDASFDENGEQCSDDDEVVWDGGIVPRWYAEKMMKEEAEKDKSEPDPFTSGHYGHSVKTGSAYRDKEVKKAFGDFMDDEKACSKQANDRSYYQECVYDTADGTASFKLMTEKVDWKNKFSGTDTEADLNMLRNLISRFVSRNYGGFSNIRKIYIRDCVLIINDVCVYPDIQNLDTTVFPVDAESYLKNGSIGVFFDWGYLSKMTSLRILDVDSIDFFLSYIAPDLRCGGKSVEDVAKFVFKQTNLSNLYVAGVLYTEESLSNTAGAEANSSPSKMKAGFFSRCKALYRDATSKDNKSFWDLAFGGKAPAVCSTMDKWREWQWSTVSNYATNRGDKGFLRYCGGCVARAAFAIAVTPLTLAPRAVKGIFSGIKGAWKAATTAVTDEDMKS